VVVTAVTVVVGTIGGVPTALVGVGPSV